MSNNKSLKILGISLLTLSLLAGCGNKPSSSEPSSSSSETTQSSEPISSNTQSSSSSSIQEKGYQIEIGGKKIELSKDDQVETGVKEQYSATLTNVTAGEEVVFYVDGKIKKPSVTQLGNNVVLNENYKTEIHNDAENVKLVLKVLTNGLEVWLDGYQNKIINNFRVTVNGEDKDVETVTTLPEGIVHKFSVKLNPQDKLVVFGDDSKLCIGDNAMHYETEYVASLPGNYIVEVNEYNRLSITEPVLTIEELYLSYVNGEQIAPNFVTPDNPEDKAQFDIELSKGDELVIKYADGSTLGSVSAVVNCSYTIYINKEGQCYPTMKNVNLNLKVTVDGQEITFEEKASGSDLAVFVIDVEANKTIVITNDGEPLPYHDTTETSFSYETAGKYKIFINGNLQVWDEPYVEVPCYGLRGSFEGGDNWQTTVFLTEVSEGVYEGQVTATAGAKFKVVRVSETDSNYIEEWIGINNQDVSLASAGTYKITFTESTKNIQFEKIA